MTKPDLKLATETTPDPFDLASLRLNPSFLETAGVKKLLTTVPARRPSPQDFVRVHPSEEYRLDVPMIDLKDDREDYLVRPKSTTNWLARLSIKRSSRPSIARAWFSCGQYGCPLPTKGKRNGRGRLVKPLKWL